MFGVRSNRHWAAGFLSVLFMFILLGVSGCALWPEVAYEKEEPAAPPSVRLSHDEVEPGGYLVITVDDVEDEHTIRLHPAGPVQFVRRGNSAVGLLGISAAAEPGEQSVGVEVRSGDRMLLFEHHSWEVKAREFPTQHLQTTPQMRETRRSELYEEDREHYRRAYAETSDGPLWEEDFLQPTEGRISTEFGVVRYVDGEISGRHSGLDIAAPTGTPVKATNRGIVRLAAHLNAPGKIVIVDHGMNVHSVYMHLSRISVKEGEMVERGEEIGEVGSTGFSTGPHLHWTMSIGRIPVCPDLILEQDPLQIVGDVLEEDMPR